MNKDIIKRIDNKSNFIYGKLDNNFIYFEIVSEEKQKKLFINSNEFKSENYINEFLINIIESYPNLDEEYVKYFFSKYFDIDNNFSRKKNYFVNKLDREIQQHLRLNPVPISKFSQVDRLFFINTKNNFLELNKKIFITKLSENNTIELIYVLKNIYNLNNVKEVKNIYNKYKQNKSINFDFPILIYLEDFHYLNSYKNKINTSILNKLNLFIELIKNLTLDISNNTNINLTLVREIILMDLYLLNDILNNININSDFKYLNKDINIILDEINILIKFLDVEILVLDFKSITLRLNIIKSYLNILETNIDKIHLTNNKIIESDSSIKLLDKFPINRQPDWGKIFITPHEIMEIESNATSLWIITPDFYFELQTYFDYFENLIINNLSEGKTFQYFYPPEARAFAKQVKNKYKKINTKGTVSFNEVPELSNFFMLFDYEIILYDPDKPTSKYHSGFFTDFFKEKETHSTTKPISIVHTRLSDKKINQIIKILTKYELNQCIY